MRYSDLHELIFSSSSSRRYFLSLPVKTQISLHELNDRIHTAAELHRMTDTLEKYRHHCNVSDSLFTK